MSIIMKLLPFGGEKEFMNKPCPKCNHKITVISGPAYVDHGRERLQFRCKCCGYSIWTEVHTAE